MNELTNVSAARVKPENDAAGTLWAFRCTAPRCPEVLAKQRRETRARSHPFPLVCDFEGLVLSGGYVPTSSGVFAHSKRSAQRFAEHRTEAAKRIKFSAESATEENAKILTADTEEDAVFLAQCRDSRVRYISELRREQSKIFGVLIPEDAPTPIVKCARCGRSCKIERVRA